jgi:hypothetical protein
LGRLSRGVDLRIIGRGLRDLEHQGAGEFLGAGGVFVDGGVDWAA